MRAHPKAKCISLLGTGSDVGKSFIVAGVCRALRQRGFKVAPYKAQNMSNNSFVTMDGLEMGRAQVVQAEAAGIEPQVDMNPVLLKPSGDCESQVVLQGRVLGSQQARDYFKQTQSLFAPAMESLERLRDQYEVVVLEGAGSCAEVNLRDRDIVNFPPAHASDATVILIADIDRGGVFAQIVGSLEVMRPEDRQRVAGIIINRFRGDLSLFEDGVRWLEERTGLPILGVLPFDRSIAIDSEDGMAVETVVDPQGALDPEHVSIATLLFPRISNHTDLAALQCSRGVDVHFLSRPRSLIGYDQLILPGSKNVRADLEWLRQTGWDQRIAAYVEAGGRVGGICGGYQMMGESVNDPFGVEGQPGVSQGLGLLAMTTELTQEKRLARCSGIWADNGQPVCGYEIHMGHSTASIDARLAPTVTGLDCEGATGRSSSTDGLRSADGLLWGSYMHGLFDSGAFRSAWLRDLKPQRIVSDIAGRSEEVGESEAFDTFKQRQYDALGQHIEAHLDVAKLLDLSGLTRS